MEDVQKTVDLVKAYKSDKYTIPKSLQELYGPKKILTQINQSQGTSFKAVVEKRKSKEEGNSSDVSENEWKTVERKKTKTNGKSDE